MPNPTRKNNDTPMSKNPKQPPPVNLDLTPSVSTEPIKEEEFDPVAVKVGCAVLLGLFGLFVFLTFRPFSGKRDHDPNVRIRLHSATQLLRPVVWTQPSLVMEVKTKRKKGWLARKFQPQRYRLTWKVLKPKGQEQILQTQGLRYRLFKPGNYKLQLQIRSHPMLSVYRIDQTLAFNAIVRKR